MKAIRQDRYGSVDVLEFGDVDKPVPGDDDLLVRVHAAGIDAGVWHLMTGLPYLLRLMGFGLRRPKTRIRGRDVAGTVEAVGRNVTRFKPGDEVFGIGEGSFAEYVVVPQAKAVGKPGDLGFEQAAAVPISALTALQALRDKGQVQKRQAVLVIGAAGGVGTYAVQIAKAFGATVTGVCSTAKTDLVRSIGADEVIDYTCEDIADRGRRYDLILDAGGNRSLTRLRRALAPRGTLVLIGSETTGRVFGGTERVLRMMLLSPFVSQRLRGLISAERGDDLLVLREMIESGKVRPVVDRAFPLAEAADAIQYVRNGHARGKVVVTV